MAISNISLTAGMRASLMSLQETSKLFDITQTRLSTGKKVNTALDDPINFFAAKGHMNRANDLAGLKDTMNEAIQTIKAADAGITAIEDLIAQAKSLANSALSTSDTTTRASYAAQFDAIRTQIGHLASDSGYKGRNLISDSAGLEVIFNEGGSSKITIATMNAQDAGDLGVAAAASSWAGDSNITAALTNLGTATTSLRNASQTLSSNLAIVQTRMDFTSRMVSTLTQGADKLTLADLNEEGANLLMLQTKQALSTTSLSLASQSAQSVLRLF